MELKPGMIKASLIRNAEFGFTDADSRTEAALVHFIRTYGQFKPVVVCKAENGMVEAIEGRKIFAACQQAGISQVFVMYCGEVTKQQAEEINLAINGIGFPINYVKLSLILKDIYPGKTKEELSHFLPFPTEDIKDFIELSDFHFSQFQPTTKNKNENQFSLTDSLFSEQQEE